ncbi:transporter substrate-binding domain-containing protein [Catenovulum sp. 2E275]|uniref:transporter substrate-binding domain-containing protein n=1 Tax=Catenovulum sp. 2E275 TaxID=2980497 RepID=UPI0021CED6DF|nr:transporter substrate-binding domain-containing protein [Catenovulum sp. 2E275]MCU4674092.1 transporter substrate-binding domain-containing protein [Catenovulum sp. 2E275]
MLKILILLITLICLPCVAATDIKYTRISDEKSQYFVKLIKLALEKAGADKAYNLKESKQTFNQQQQVERLLSGELSIMWAGTQPEYENKLQPVRIPLMKGLQGHRIFLIRKGTQAEFDKVNTLQDLQQLKAGQGRFWGDTPILEHAGLPVVAPVKKENLFYMLDGARFDYLPLGVHEPWDEVNKRENINLAVEQSLLLIYPMPMYFFVSKDNEKLRQIIESGLEAAISDGSFDELFYNAPHVKNALDLAKLANRKVIKIANPNLNNKTPINRPELWLKLEE